MNKIYSFLLLFFVSCSVFKVKHVHNSCHLVPGKYKVLLFSESLSKTNLLEDFIQLELEYTKKRNYDFTWIASVNDKDKVKGFLNFNCIDTLHGEIKSVDSYKMLNAIYSQIQNTNAQKLIYTSAFTSIYIKKLDNNQLELTYQYNLNDSIKQNYTVVLLKVG